MERQSFISSGARYAKHDRKIRKWRGNPHTCPHHAAARLEIGQQVDILAVDGQIVIRSDRVQRYNLAELVEEITPDNLHDLINFGDAVGREGW